MQFLAGNAVALLENGGQYFPALEAEIDRAEREIFLQSYIFEDDGTGARIAAALARAAGRGVAVRVMVDGFGGRSFVSRLMPRLREAGVQVRVEGEAQLVSAAEADAYFASRPRMSQVGAWASMQSQPLASREEFEQRLQRFEAQFEGRDVPRPDGWSGIRIVPQRIEFWYGVDFRLHERWFYEADGAGNWSKRLLYP